MKYSFMSINTNRSDQILISSTSLPEAAFLLYITLWVSQVMGRMRDVFHFCASALSPWSLRGFSTDSRWTKHRWLWRELFLRAVNTALGLWGFPWLIQRSFVPGPGCLLQQVTYGTTFFAKSTLLIKVIQTNKDHSQYPNPQKLLSPEKKKILIFPQVSCEWGCWH